MKTTRRANRRAQEGLLKLPDERQPLKRKENWRKLLLLGIQTGDKLAKPPFFVAYSRLCRHCRNLAAEGCRLSPFHFRLCRYFLGHVACRNLPWQGLFFRLPWVPEVQFSSFVKGGAFFNRERNLFDLRNFENRPLKPGNFFVMTL